MRTKGGGEERSRLVVVSNLVLALRVLADAVGVWRKSWAEFCGRQVSWVPCSVSQSVKPGARTAHRQIKSYENMNSWRHTAEGGKAGGRRRRTRRGRRGTEKPRLNVWPKRINARCPLLFRPPSASSMRPFSGQVGARLAREKSVGGRLRAALRFSCKAPFGAREVCSSTAVLPPAPEHLY